MSDHIQKLWLLMNKQPTIHCIGNAHLDPAWMWSWREGFAAFASTIRSALERISETEEFIFTVSSAACFKYIEQTDPALFKRIHEQVHAGKISLVGGWWVEPDCNLPSGESFIRQGLYGQSYFYEKFGRYCKTGYCIDSFGHAATLPMLLQACGLERYVFMRPQEHEKDLAAPLFQWQSPSGDSVTAYRIPLHYSNFAKTIEEKITDLSSVKGYSSIQPWMIFYGVGNHGGGPTKEHIKKIKELQETTTHRLLFSSVDDFFEEIEQQKMSLPILVDELQYHAIGAYSAHAEIKRLNREAEAGLIKAEIFAALSEKVTSLEADWQSIELAWEKVLLNQFHDTLGGVAIKEASDEIVSSYHSAIAIAKEAETISLGRIVASIDTSAAIENLIVFNPNSFPIEAPVEFDLWNPEASEKGIVLESLSLEHSGGLIAAQRIEASGKIGNDSVRFVSKVPVSALGWNTFSIGRHQLTETDNPFIITYNSISNGIVSFSLAESWYSPAVVCDDQSDTWGHGQSGFNEVEGSFAINSVAILEEGPIRARMRITSTYNRSTITEDIILYRSSDQIEHRVRLDWQEKHKVCKLQYKHGAIQPAIRCEIPYGSILRKTMGQEVSVSRWAFIEGEGSGFGVIGATKSSYSFDSEMLYQTVARSALYAHHTPPHILGEKEDLRYLDQGIQEFTNMIIPAAISAAEAQMPKRCLEVCNKPEYQIESSHLGTLAGKYSFFELKNSLVLTALKRKKSQTDKALIARIYNGCDKDLALNIVDFLVDNSRVQSNKVQSYILDEKVLTECDALERKVGKSL